MSEEIESAFLSYPEEIRSELYALRELIFEVAFVRVALSEGRIASWREYFESGPASFDELLAVEDKDWEWTADSLR